MEKHFVNFHSPGTMMAEQSSKPIDKWDVDKAIEIARTIKERHGAVPYGFRFSTRSRSEDDLDSKESDISNLYYLGGKVETLKQVEDRNDPNDRILISNMRNNDYNKIITNTNSWKWTQPLNDDDVVLDVTF